VTLIACGNIHNLAVTQEGKVFAWGGAHYGLLGLGDEKLSSLPVDEGSSQPYQPTPTMLDSISHERVVQVACGSAHNLAVTQDGHVWAWGGAKYGRLGVSRKALAKMPVDEDGDPYQPRPVRIDTLAHAAIHQVACGEWHSLCLSDDGSVYAFGSAMKGRLGLGATKHLAKDDTEPCVPTPERIVGFEGKKVIGLSASAYFSLALTEGGDVWAWGQTAAGWLSVACTAVVGVPDFQPIPAHLNLAPRTHVMPAALRLTQDAPLLVIVSKEKWQTPAAELGLRGLGLPLLEAFMASPEFADVQIRVKVRRAHAKPSQRARWGRGAARAGHARGDRPTAAGATRGGPGGAARGREALRPCRREERPSRVWVWVLCVPISLTPVRPFPVRLPPSPSLPPPCSLFAVRTSCCTRTESCSRARPQSSTACSRTARRPAQTPRRSSSRSTTCRSAPCASFCATATTATRTTR
jgi:hypothetical protein